MIDLAIQKKLDSSQSAMQLDVALKIEPGELLTLYGKSGAGKTSLLRILAGLLQPDSGHLKMNDTFLFDSQKNIFLPPQQRKIGLLFQDYALFPNMTVIENLRFAQNNNQKTYLISELISIMELESLQNRKPATLSGGEQQRVALARALVQQPELLLLDEPLAALDLDMRQRLQDYLLQVHEKYQLTTVLVSHDVEEILKMSDRVIHLDNGRIIGEGTAEEMLNQVNSIRLVGKVMAIKGNDVVVQVADNQIIIPKSKNVNYQVGDKVEVIANLIQARLKQK